MLALIPAALVVAWLPGALAFRLPVARRERRAALAAEERVFWHVILSLAWSLAVVLALAAFEAYTFTRLLAINVAVAAGLVAAIGRRFRYEAPARPGWTAALPVLILAAGAWQFFPPSEYVIGGKDPGTYLNEGVQMDVRGSLVIHDEVVAAVPAATRDLFFPLYPDQAYYSLRFMGFFVQDPDTGAVVGQFPHLFPASIAIGYGLDGLRGARHTTGVWALLGLLAVYFAGTRLLGRPAGLAAALLLTLHVIEVWFARYPNAEVVMQTLLFAALLAFARAHQDGDRFFAPVAGGLAGLLVFLRVDALLALLAIAAAAVLAWIVDGRRPRPAFVALLAAGLALGWLYLSGPLRGYLALPEVYLRNLPRPAVLGALFAAAATVAILVWLRRRGSRFTRAAAPALFLLTLLGAAFYAWFLRAPGGLLTDYDAWALRTFTDFYLFRAGLVLALIGLYFAARRHFWHDPALLCTFAAFALYFFYKIRIVPDHFWAARRFLPVILPVALLLAAAAALGTPASRQGIGRIARGLAGLVVLMWLGLQYAAASAPVRGHVEYEGMMAYVERLAARFGDDDLVLTEARDTGSDLHVLGLPLAYVHGRNVLQLASPVPDKARLHAFLADARARHRRVFFVGGGGTDLLSRRILARPVGGDTVQIPEYDSPRNAYPSGVRRKEFDYSIYELTTGEARPGPFVLDVGSLDDLHVLRFHAKERTEGRSIRWTRAQSFVAVPGLAGDEREVVFVLHDGGRPPGAGPAELEVFFGETADDEPLGTLRVGAGFDVYRLPLPPDAVRRLAASNEPARLRLVSTVWIPRDWVGGSDDRALGVMIDRIEVR